MPLDIRPQKNVFDDHFLDVIGNEFKFDHVKGLAEWLKNSADAYVREGVPDDDAFIWLRLSSRTKNRPARLEVIDFVGMAKDDIDNAFKRWGDPRAATRETGRRVLGGHGNGGKFYMRQMFKISHFVTYRNGKLNIFGFNEKKRYGYASNHEEKPMKPGEALALAGLVGSTEIPPAVRKRWAKGEVGFTVVVGEDPRKFKGEGSLADIQRRLCVHSQSRRLVKHKPIIVVRGDASARLVPDEILPRPGFEEPFEAEIPETLDWDGQKFAFRNGRYPQAHLKLWTSAHPFSRTGDKASLNSIDILGEVGCIGSYRLNELGYLRYSAEAEFIYGECFCPILEDPEDDCVRNDRGKLVESEKTQALLAWLRQQVDVFTERMADKEKDEKRRAELKQSTAFNEMLNRWKNTFMEKIFAEVFGGPGGVLVNCFRLRCGLLQS
jgi:hypothetical protein